MLGKHDLVMGYFQDTAKLVCTAREYAAYIHEFKNIILDVELFWAIEFLRIIHAHLKSTRLAKTHLVNKKAIHLMIDGAVMHITLAEQYRNYAEDLLAENISDCQLSAVKELRLAAQLLAKLHGGKSFLSGNVVEMMMIFEYFRDCLLYTSPSPRDS